MSACCDKSATETLAVHAMLGCSPPGTSAPKARAPIAIGDTFCRVGETDAWEVTAEMPGDDCWHIERGREQGIVHGARLLDVTHWTRVRCP